MSRAGIRGPGPWTCGSAGDSQSGVADGLGRRRAEVKNLFRGSQTFSAYPLHPRADRQRRGTVARRRERTKVLILARETVIAALIGMLLELEHYQPVYAEPDERPEDAIRRVQPPLIVMLDGEIDAATSDLFYARAAAAGASVVLFSEPLAADEIRAVARDRRLPCVVMPVDRATLGRVLDLVASG